MLPPSQSPNFDVGAADLVAEQRYRTSIYTVFEGQIALFFLLTDFQSPGGSKTAEDGGNPIRSAENPLAMQKPTTQLSLEVKGFGELALPKRKATRTTEERGGGKWKVVKDKATGKTYYYNTSTKKSTWSKPEDLEG